MRTKEQIIEFIQINHHFTTIKEMAEELAVKDYQVVAICKKLNITPIRPSDRLKEYIADHKDKTAEEVAELFDVTITNVRLIERQLGLKLADKKKQTVTASRKSFTKQERDGLVRALADVVSGMTPEEKKSFADRWIEF
jgi:PP-loop superfamily ATP-utilizing enzyme